MIQGNELPDVQQISAEVIVRLIAQLSDANKEIATLKSRLFYYQCADSESINYHLKQAEETNEKLFKANEELGEELAKTTVAVDQMNTNFAALSSLYDETVKYLSEVQK